MRAADDAPTSPDPPSRPYLVHALACDRPATPPSRWSLTRVADVVLSGEGPISAARTGTLTIACDDPWVSSRHAALKRSFGRWVLEDVGSKNGTTVNGVRVSRHQLADGDLIETGHTAWWFREIATGAPPLDLAAIDLTAPFVTMHAPLELAATRAVAALVVGLPVLVEGEPGVGKERFVTAVHAASRRRGALVAVNCAALRTELVEGELFGHRHDAHADAVDDRVGYLRAAHRGTLFLDEISELPPAAQAALLRVLAERSVTPVGDDRAVPVDLAVISATHRDVHAMTAAGTFRPELLTRLLGVSMWIPPLRERREDIGVFVARTLARVAPGATLQPEAARRLLTAVWPGNVRELEHVVAAAALRAGPRAIALADLEGVAEFPRPATPAQATEWSAADTALRTRLVGALVAHGGNISAVARALGRDRKQIHRWVERLAINLRDPR
jgi:sigma-54 dependent transcriptional regulator, acetoin dehydrogenase operon transcriptional activator AcoR